MNDPNLMNVPQMFYTNLPLVQLAPSAASNLNLQYSALPQLSQAAANLSAAAVANNTNNIPISSAASNFPVYDLAAIHSAAHNVDSHHNSINILANNSIPVLPVPNSTENQLTNNNFPTTTSSTPSVQSKRKPLSSSTSKNKKKRSRRESSVDDYSSSDEEEEPIIYADEASEGEEEDFDEGMLFDELTGAPVQYALNQPADFTADPEVWQSKCNLTGNTAN
jgi:hypothetical protein